MSPLETASETEICKQHINWGTFLCRGGREAGWAEGGTELLGRSHRSSGLGRSKLGQGTLVNQLVYVHAPGRDITLGEGQWRAVLKRFAAVSCW